MVLKLLTEGSSQLGYTLSPQQLRLFELYAQVLSYWSVRMNLTAITDPEEVQVKHFLDSIAIATVLNGVPPESRVIDVGTGAGFPGVPLKVIRPDLRLVLLESIAKKVTFLHHLLAHLGLDGVEVVMGRAEDVARDLAFREQFPVVVSRAVAPLPVLLELTVPFCRLGGMIVAPKSGDVIKEIDLARPALEVLGGQLKEARKVELAGLEGHVLVVVSKVASTPPQYPRRAGMPSKRPIGERGPGGRSSTGVASV
ncbi:MAG: 16S rRNA (guanine(527)-N(7))-methyltransferase RsmG [Chloroflexi bacterium]|nr:16S rRNA (guanine(527)-N(7))-methyltransferase RsmG [Chloroflexota bacterium]